MNSSSSCLVLLLLAGFHLISSAEDKYYTDCAPYPFNCGNIGNISYPFLAGDRPEYCGHPDFELSCENNSPEIRIASVAYRVLDIREEDQILTIVEKNFVENECPSPAQGPDMRLVPLEYTIRDALIDFVYDCSSPITNSSLVEVPCLQNNRGLPAYYTTLKPTELSPVFFQKCKVATIMIFIEALSRLLVNQTPLVEVLREGFQVRWSVGTDWCSECSDSGGRCGYNRSNPYERPCFCSDQPRPFACLPVAAAPAPRSPPSGIAGKDNKRIIAIGVSCGVGSFFLACLLSLFLVQRYLRRRRRLAAASSTLLSSNVSPDPSSKHHDLEKSTSTLYTHIFSYTELEEATDNFDASRELGDGGFGTVYFGKLRDGRSVAVKRLYENNYRRVEQFMNEVKILSSLRHPNLVTLYGCTSRHSRELLLVYEFVPNGTVADHIHGERAEKGALTWPVRMSIAIETAEALAYLHGVEPPIIHRDVKTNNILLDNNFHVKVADFGLSRLFPLDVTHVSTTPQGTPGYVDPDYHKCYQLTDKSDVYSFGVVLIELISSKPAVDITRHRHEINLASMALNKIHSGALHELVDLSLGFESDFRARRMITMVAELAYRCLQEEKETRPPMEEVAQVLRGIAREENGMARKPTATQEMELPKDDVGLLEKMPPPSPDSVMDNWGSHVTTPNIST